MTTLLTFTLLTATLLAPFALVAVLAARTRRPLRWDIGRRRFLDDQFATDARRIDHDLDAVRTRFEQHPAWPQSGTRDERG